MSTFIKLDRFWNFTNIKIIVYFDVFNHCILKKFQECNVGSFPSELFDQEHKLWNVMWEFFY
jgi:hypothetical protein